MNNDIKHLKNGDFEVMPRKQTFIGFPVLGEGPYGAKPVLWRVDGEWEHKGWLMPQVT